MKVTLEFVIRDEEGNILSQNTPVSMDIGTQSLHDIEGGVEMLRQKVLPEIEVTLLTQAQNRYTEAAKKKLNLRCNGTRNVWIKTLHGKFQFCLQKYQINKEEINYFQLSNQLQERYVSPRLEELCGHYANCLSYENLEDLVERMTGERLLSDPTIWAIIQAKAETYSQQIRQQAKTTLNTTNSSKIEVNPTVKIYSVEEPEILLFDDGIQVKGQKTERVDLVESTTNNQSPELDNKTPVVLTDVAMLQTPKGEFEYLVAPLDIDGEESLNLATVIRARIIDLYGKAAQPLNIVAITDGAKNDSSQTIDSFWRCICPNFGLVSPM